MSIRGFLKLVEIQTKVASMTPFLFGTLYALYRYKSFNPVNFLLMLVSLLAIDMATTAINNFYDYKRANKTYGYNYESHNAIVSHKMKEGTVITVIFILLGAAAVFGFLLFLNTNIIVLILGAISFMIGVLYSFGPIPISRTPFGEAFSGIFMGFIIVFITLYIHIYDHNVLTILYKSGTITINANILEIFFIFLVSVPLICGIANIMLANNICDIEDDIENKRFTLPVYVGRKNALIIFRALYYISYVAIFAAVLLKAAPITALLVLITFIPVNRNINTFSERSLKGETFVLSVKNFIIMNITYIASVLIALIIRLFTV